MLCCFAELKRKVNECDTRPFKAKVVSRIHCVYHVTTPDNIELKRNVMRETGALDTSKRTHMQPTCREGHRCLLTEYLVQPFRAFVLGWDGQHGV